MRLSLTKGLSYSQSQGEGPKREWVLRIIVTQQISNVLSLLCGAIFHSQSLVSVIYKM